jgi:hypothetical protein
MNNYIKINPIGGVVDLTNLADVNAPTPSINDVLTWSGIEWINQSISVPSDGWELSGTDSQLSAATTNAIIGDDKKLIFGNSGDAWITYNATDFGELVWQSRPGYSDLVAPDGLNLYSGAGNAGLGNYEPSLTMIPSDGTISLRSVSTGVTTNQLLIEVIREFADDVPYSVVNLNTHGHWGYIGDGATYKHTFLSSTVGSLFLMAPSSVNLQNGILEINTTDVYIQNASILYMGANPIIGNTDYLSLLTAYYLTSGQSGINIYGDTGITQILSHETIVGQFDFPGSANHTSLWLYDTSNISLVRVLMGANDSGGVGYKALIVPN